VLCGRKYDIGRLIVQGLKRIRDLIAQVDDGTDSESLVLSLYFPTVCYLEEYEWIGYGCYLSCLSQEGVVC